MPARKPPEGFISIPDAAKIAGCCPMTMYRLTAVEGLIPCVKQPVKDRTRYFVKKQDVEKYLSRFRLNDRGRQPAVESRYEIVIICERKMDVLFSTNSLLELSHKYCYMIEKGHKLIRVREDGKVLTIHESDRLGYSYHPRTKNKGVI